MLRYFLMAGLILVLLTELSAQFESGITIPDTSQKTVQDDVSQIASSISAADLKQHLYILASDSFGGRELGSEGNLMAAEYIENHFSSLGLKSTGPEGSYFQKVAFTWLFWKDVYMTVNGKRYKQLWDFIAFPEQNKGCDIQTSEVVFLGYGIDTEHYSDYKKVDVKDKVVIIYDKEPRNKKGNYLLSESDRPSVWSRDVKLKLNSAAKHGVKHVLIVSENLKQLVEDNRRTLLGPKVILGEWTDDMRAPVDYSFISSTMAKDLVGDQIDEVIKARKCINKRGKAKSVVLSTDLQITQTHRKRFVDGVNVIALSEGTEKPDEYLIISAHFDHIGMKGKDINNGADDNASGTSTVLELAEAFSKAKSMGLTHKRSVVFALMTGEEKGLLGSEFYSENPVFPLENSIANINIDMVGRLHKDYLNNPNYIYVIGSDRLSSDLHRINEDVNQKYEQLTLDYKYNDENDSNRFYYRSDHYNFAKKGIPAIFFFNGTHADYHRPTDTADKIEYEKMAKIGRHIFALAWELANREERIVVDGIIK